MAVLHTPHVAVTNSYEPTIQPEVEAALKSILELELPSEDGIPLETNWHRSAMNVLIDSVHSHWRERQDYFAGGNMFIYFSVEQALNRDYRGPDFFVVKGVDGTRDRDSWVVWREAGRYPNLIIELASPSTITTDLETKKALYAETFRTPEYFCYDPAETRLYGWDLSADGYLEIEANTQGWLWSQELRLWVGLWQGEFQRIRGTWLRFYDSQNQLVLTEAEAEAQRAEAEAQRAEAEAQRADAAEAEVARLRALLAEKR